MFKLGICQPEKYSGHLIHQTLKYKPLSKESIFYIFSHDIQIPVSPHVYGQISKC